MTQLPPCTALRIEMHRRIDRPMKDLISRDLGGCKYAFEIIIDDADHFFFAFDAHRCVAAASCEVHPVQKSLEVNYVCSSGTCRGGGTFLMREIERYARSFSGLNFVSLVSDPKAAKFYRKLGYTPAILSGNRYELNMRRKIDAEYGAFITRLRGGRKRTRDERDHF